MWRMWKNILTTITFLPLMMFSIIVRLVKEMLCKSMTWRWSWTGQSYFHDHDLSFTDQNILDSGRGIMQRRDNSVQGACIILHLMYTYCVVISNSHSQWYSQPLLINVTCELFAHFPPPVSRWARCLILTTRLKYCCVTRTCYPHIYYCRAHDKRICFEP